jgi:hypothetical protein
MLRFSSPFCRESDIRVYGSFHGCVDFLLVARVIFMSFSGYFHWIFVRDLFFQFRGEGPNWRPERRGVNGT